ncbi:MAG: M13 family metallopeptidase [Bacteroidales bacterium]|nr:M13 family metallopeptidase [Bacteroidales bacterium]MDD4217430.1 M13 family metallopeptidase [Bacteroidales bacterium]MDY0141709.1 M13 family metallopeptidase [Bacteroidales bacterium]
MDNTKQTKEVKAINISDLDTTVSPGEDFYQYATGGWQKNNPLPDEESRYGSFDVLAKETNQKVNELIKHLTEQENEPYSIEWKIEKFYSLGMDSARIDKDGLTPIELMLSKIDKISTKEELTKQIAELHRQGISSTFNVFGSADRENSEMQIAYLYQGGIGLPNRDYYTGNDDRSKEIRTKYLSHIENMLIIAGFDKDLAHKNAQEIYNLEHQLAEKSMTNLELRDPFATTNRMSVAEIKEVSPSFDYQLYFNEINLPVPGTINLSQPNFFKQLSYLYENIDIETWKTYLKWNVINFAAPYLHSEMVNTNWRFYGKFLTGALTQQPRWRRVVSKTNACLGEGVGQIFVKEYFPPEAKDRMISLVENLRASFAERITQLEWMTPETKEKALKKLAKINVKIGYPDKWKDYEKLNIEDDSFFANIIRANVFEFDDMISEIGKPVDKTKWFMNPQTVNAYYSSNMNEICFPAGILQPPFFYMNADDAVNYGAIGVVIGHEMTHGFDDKGRNYDLQGNLNDWWTKEDAELFNAQTQILVERFNNIKVLNDLNADGKLSLGENIADYGGLVISYDALMKALNGQTPEKIDGFTAEQRFYLAYAKIWAQNVRDTEIRRRTKEDVHSLGKWRVNGQLPGLETFHKAFNVKKTDPMYLPKDKWANIW